MQIVIPLQRMSAQLELRMQSHAKKFGYGLSQLTASDVAASRVNRSRITEILEGVLTDHVTMRLKSVDAPTALFDEAILKLFPHWNARTRAQFKKEVLADFEEELERYIAPCLPQYAWHIWYSQIIGFDILITIGRDWRIVEWERLTGYED